jgi:hypothetical protein
MTRFDLSAEEVHDLVEVIDYRLAELRQEIVHTDDREFRNELNDAAKRLENLRLRVGHIAAELPARVAPSALAKGPATLP